jgi:quinol monooxygenase YgiN
MYGTIATFHVIPGKQEELQRHNREEVVDIPGLVFQHIFRTEADPDILMLVVGFESREAYRANAESPEQHRRYEQYRALLSEDPEWHDGEIIYTSNQATG